MSFVNKTNSFFGNHVYFNLAKFAVLPVSWIFQTERTEHGLDFPDLGKIVLGVFLSPILIPATIVTTAAALNLALLSALVHCLALFGSIVLDSFAPTNHTFSRV